MKPTQTFNDGVVKIHSITTVGNPGFSGTEKIKAKCSMRYKRRTIGVNRMYLAAQARQAIDLLIRCPYRSEITEGDVAIPVDGHQYLIKSAKVQEGIRPLVMDLTLERLLTDYGVIGHG